MNYSLYDGSIVTAKSALTSLDHILNEAEKSSNVANLPTAQLCEDMKPLTFQVHIATLISEKLVARLTGREAINLDNDLVSFADMRERTQKVLRSLDEADKDVVNQHAEEQLPTPLGPLTLEMTGNAFASAFAVPNIFFHLNIAYAILRKEGVPLGKRDYLGSFLGPYMPKSE